MEALSVLHYEDPQPFYSADSSNHSLHSASAPIFNSNLTYTSLEPVYPEVPFAPTNLQYLGASSSASYYNYASNYPVYAELPPLNSIVKDEGVGSSISSTSSRRSSNSTPDSTVSSASNFAAECASCTSKENIYWQNTHYLCAQCLPQMTFVSPQRPASVPEQTNGGRRKRSTGNKHLNQVCTNCEITHSTLWRRNIAGDNVCNACGLYERLHNNARPKSMRKDTIQTRKRKSKIEKSPKSKKPSKKAPKKQEVRVDHPQYTPNIGHYSLPHYESLQMRNLNASTSAMPSTSSAMPSTSSAIPSTSSAMPSPSTVMPSTFSPMPSMFSPMSSTSSAMPMDNNQLMYLNYRPEWYRQNIYSPVSPNDIINVPPTGMHFTNC